MEERIDELDQKIRTLEYDQERQSERLWSLERDRPVLREQLSELERRLTELELLVRGIPGRKQCACGPVFCLCPVSPAEPGALDRLAQLETSVQRLDQVAGRLVSGAASPVPEFNREALQARAEAIARRIASWQEIPEGVQRLGTDE